MPLFCAVFGACRPQGPPPPLAVEVAGCADILRPGPVCLLRVDSKETSAKLTLWLPPSASRSRPEVSLDGRPVEARSVPAGEGERIELLVPAKEGRLEVRRQGPGGLEAWSLSLALRSPEPEWFDRAYQLATSGQPGAAERARELLLAQLPDATPYWQASALSVLARLPGDEAAELRLKRALAARRTAGQIYGEVYDAETLARLYRDRFDLNAAEAVLDGIELPPWAPAEALFLLGFERAVLEQEAGEGRRALRSFRAVAARADRLNLAAQRATAEHARALLLLDLGRFEEAEEALAGMAGEIERAEPCERLAWTGNRGWARLLAREAGRDAGDPESFLRAAREQLATSRCSSPRRAVNASLNLALGALQRGDLSAAGSELEQARRGAAVARGEMTGVERLWMRELQARWEAARGRPSSARRLYQGLVEEARVANDREALWRADLGLARALAATGAQGRERALEVLREAEEIVDRQAALVPWPGRARFVAQREAGARLRIELLLEAGRPEEALRAARRSRARVPRELVIEARIEALHGVPRAGFLAAVARYRMEQRRCDTEREEEWRLSLPRQAEARWARADRCQASEAELEERISDLGRRPRGEPEATDRESFRPPLSGEVILAYHPLPQGWVGFAADASGVAAHRFVLPRPLPPPEDLARLLLVPFRDRLAAAGRIRVLAYGELEPVDLHALPFLGAPLVSGRTVVYGLDLAAPQTAVSSPAGSRIAQVVADPRGDLPNARREAEAVVEVLGRAGWTVRLLKDRRASVEGVLAALREGDLLHYAGHALSGDAEEGGELLLAGSGRLAAAEILALERVPPWVVLAGCDTGVADRGAAAEGLGLAQAFLLRGARQVVATLRPVADEETAQLFAAFYAERGEIDLALRLRRMQARALAGEGGAVARAAASFRVYEP